MRAPEANEIEFSVRTSTLLAPSRGVWLGRLSFLLIFSLLLKLYIGDFFIVGVTYILFILYHWHLIGKVDLNTNSIAYTALLHPRQQLQWDEICEVQTDAKKSTLSFLSLDGRKRLVIPAARLWFGREKWAMEQMLAEGLRNLAIEITPTKCDTHFQSKNTHITMKILGI